MMDRQWTLISLMDGAANGFGGVSSDEEAQAIGLFALHTKSAFTPYFSEGVGNGRVKPGVCFCLYTKYRYEKLLRPF